MRPRSRWLDNAVFGWQAECGSWKINHKSSVHRAYEYWEHARQLLESPTSQFQLADAIANLKRAVNHRLKAIERAYSLRSFPLANRPPSYLAILESVGLVRPALLKYLMDVRNAIEHEDKRPPSPKRCGELLDMSWYFLRSTDAAIREISSSVEYGYFTELEEPTQYGFTVHLRFGKRPRFDVSGWFPAEMVTQERNPLFSQLTTSTIDTKLRWKGHGAQDDKLDTDLWIIADLEPSPLAAQSIIVAALGVAYAAGQ